LVVTSTPGIYFENSPAENNMKVPAKVALIVLAAMIPIMFLDSYIFTGALSSWVEWMPACTMEVLTFMIGLFIGLRLK
jgi:hypothetical protein